MKPRSEKRNSFNMSLIVPLTLIAALVFVPNKITKRIQKTVKTQWMILNNQLIDAGEAHLWIECRGTGNPTVVMDAGLNMTRESWGIVPEETAKFTRVCIYERAGLGDSEQPLTKPRTSADIVADLNELLKNKGEKEPFLLVGHSFGGFNARLFAQTFPQKVSGLVLLDSSSEDEFELYASLKNPEKRAKYLAHEGGENYERVNLLESAKQIRSAPALPKIPVAVISATSDFYGEEEKLKEFHLRIQTDLAQKLSAKSFIIVNDSGHFIQKDRPQIVIDSIKSLIK